jgi:cyanophycinase-like exopeptidase
LATGSNQPLNSVRTILFKNKKATSEPEILDALRNAEAIFLAGGDQGEYLDYWTGTEVQSIIQQKLNSNVTIGGTSAGCMVQGNWVFSAEVSSVTSDTVLQNPYDKGVTIVPAFVHIPFLENVITDTHFGKCQLL